MPITLGVCTGRALPKERLADKAFLKRPACFKIDPTVSGQAPPTWVCAIRRFLTHGFHHRPVTLTDARIDLLFTMSDNTYSP